MTDGTTIAWHFIRTRWLLRFRSRQALLDWQGKQVEDFQRRISKEGELPVIGKTECRARFRELNPFGISLEEAEAVALVAERERDFSPVIGKGITVGLSSGTSGSRSVFLVTRKDRLRWAGIVLARALSGDSVKRLLCPWKPKLKIAFFLRADSNLYQTVASRRIEFRYFDLLKPFAGLMEALENFQPDILIAPATVLAEIAKSDVAIRPSQIISVAEVLDERDETLVRECFGVRPGQIYQAAEGFIGATCAEGRMHLNEEHLRIEEEWLDETRFYPVITDFSRSGQQVLRVRLDDILVADDRTCPCGRVSRTIARIEGRADEVLRFGSAIFPDAVRRALYAMPEPPENYRIEQHGARLHVLLKPSSPSLELSVADALRSLFSDSGIALPGLIFEPWFDQPAGEKQRRIRCVTPLSPS